MAWNGAWHELLRAARSALTPTLHDGEQTGIRISGTVIRFVGRIALTTLKTCNMNILESHSNSQYLLLIKASFIAALSFAALGTVTALWENPFFIRMTPTSGFEIALLSLQAIMFGIYLSIPSNHCPTKTLSAGGVLGFLGIACPVCNKILLYAFGAELLLSYLEPARVYLAIIGTLVVGLALYIKLKKRQGSTVNNINIVAE